MGGIVIGGNVGTVTGSTAVAGDIRPERTRELEVGLDASLLNGRASLAATGFVKQTSSLLIPRTPQPSTGISVLIANGGTLRNLGIEVSVGMTVAQTGNLNWVTRASLSSIRDKVLSLPVPGFRPPDAGFGLPFGEFFVQQGRPITQIIGTDSNGRVVFLGQANPKLVMSLMNTVTTGMVSVSFAWNWQSGGVGLNHTLALYDCNDLAPDGGTPAGRARHDACLHGDARPFVQSTNFLRLDDVTLEAELPKRWLEVLSIPARSLRVSLAGKNLLLFTHYFGYDPMVSNFGEQSLARNIDAAPYPPSRQFLVSISAGF
jgi:hypothetical protein